MKEDREKTLRKKRRRHRVTLGDREKTLRQIQIENLEKKQEGMKALQLLLLVFG